MASLITSGNELEETEFAPWMYHREIADSSYDEILYWPEPLSLSAAVLKVKLLEAGSNELVQLIVVGRESVARRHQVTPKREARWVCAQHRRPEEYHGFPILQEYGGSVDLGFVYGGLERRNRSRPGSLHGEADIWILAFSLGPVSAWIWLLLEKMSIQNLTQCLSLSFHAHVPGSCPEIPAVFFILRASRFSRSLFHWLKSHS